MIFFYAQLYINNYVMLIVSQYLRAQEFILFLLIQSPTKRPPILPIFYINLIHCSNV